MRSLATPNPRRLQDCHLLITAVGAPARQRLGELLRSQGAEVTAATDGQHAIDLLTRSPFDALLAEIDMPRMTGLAMIRRIRNLPAPLAVLPILAITAQPVDAHRQTILASGADRLLCDPLQGAETLAETLEQLLRRGHQPRDASAQVDPGQIDPARFQELMQMAGPKMAAELLNHLQTDLRAAERGLVAAAQGPDWPEVRRQTHVMIALAGTAGATLLHRLAQMINTLAHHAVPDGGAFQALLPQTLEQLDLLIQFIAQQIPPPSAPPRQEPQ